MAEAVTLASHGHVRVLQLDVDGKGQNRITPTWMTRVHACLDVVENDEDATCLVTVANPTYFSTELDLKMLLHSADVALDLVRRFHELLARLLAFPKLTVAAVRGHAVAGGAMVALAHDYALVAHDATLCFREIEIGISFTSGMQALVASKVTDRRGLLRDLLLTAMRCSGAQAVERGICDEVHLPEAHGDMVAHAVELVERAGLRTYLPSVLQAIKEEMYQDALQKLRSSDVGSAWKVGRMAKL